MRDEEVRKQKPFLSRWRSCPKCGGYVVHGSYRFGQSAPDISYCFQCGLSNESSRYLDAATGAYREIDIVVTRTRHHHIGGGE